MAFVLIAAAMVAAGALLPVRVFWSPDEGAKFLQVLGYSWNGGLESHLPPYPGHEADPDYVFYPRRLAPGHPFQLVSMLYPQPLPGGGASFNWSPVFPLLSKAPLELFGLRGLYLIPMASGLLVVWLSGVLARRLEPDAGVPAMVMVGVASPVFFYSLLFWEHTLGVALGLTALSIALVPGPHRWGRACLAGGLLLLAVWIRFELVLLALALLGAALAPVMSRDHAVGSPSRRRLRVGAAAALLAIVLGLTLLALAGAGGPADRLGGKEAAYLELSTALYRSPHFWSTLPQRLLNTWVGTPAGSGPQVPRGLAAVFLAGVLLAGLAVAVAGRKRALLLATGVALATAVAFWVVVEPERFREIHGLLLPAPYLLFAPLFIFPALRRGDPLARQLAWTTLVFFALATVAMLPGLVGRLEWGNRYLLVAYPLGGVCAAAAVAQQLRTLSRGRRIAVLALSGLSLTAGFLFELRGVRELALTKADLTAVADVLRRDRLPVVTDQYWLPSALAERFVEQPIFTVAGKDQLGAWLDVVAGRVRRFRIATIGALPADVEGWFQGASGHPLRLVDDRTEGGLRLLDFDLLASSRLTPR